ncbi:MAG: hypothetical protein ACXAEJ_15685 [Candidatus Thorarchaeota archaeon]
MEWVETLCTKCHSTTEQQKGVIKMPRKYEANDQTTEQQKGVIKMPRKYEANDQTTIDELRKKRVEAGSLTANSFTFSLLH